MHSTLPAQSDATTRLTHPTKGIQIVEPCRVRTPQRKAIYHDKHRVKFKDAKKWALVASGCFSTKEVKYWLKKLKVRLSLRMTSAWVAIWKELAPSIKSAKQTETNLAPMSAPTTKIKVGDKVEWTGYTAMQSYICQWFPLEVLSIDGDMAYLELISFPVPVAEIVLAA
jgi:hypothetical protein